MTYVNWVWKNGYWEGDTVPDVPPAPNPNPNFIDGETVSGSGTAWTLAHSPNPVASLILIQQVTGFGGITLIANTDYTISGTAVTTTNNISAGTLRAWYRY